MSLHSIRRTGGRTGLVALFALAVLPGHASAAPRPPVARVVPHTLEGARPDPR
jgi:hypothetical protein